MSSISKRYSQVARDYGRKSYLTDEDVGFASFMKKKTFFQFDAQYKAPWSEFEKPYLEDSYEGMEQYLQNPPGIPWDWQDWPFDNPSLPPGAYDIPAGGGGWPSLTVFTCSISGCFCPGDTKTVTAHCSHEITGIHLASPTARVSKEFSISGEGGGTTAQIEITASEDAGGACEIDIDMDANGIHGSHDSIMVTSCSECDPNCDDVTPVELDEDLTQDMLARNHTAVVYGHFGRAPYTWEISGTGATVLLPVTQSPNTVIKAGPTACGTLTVTVTDACDNQSSIQILSDGRWVRVYTGTGGIESDCGECSDYPKIECNGPYFVEGNPWYPLKNIKFDEWMCSSIHYCCCMSKTDGDPVGSTCYPTNINYPELGAVFCWNPCGEKTSSGAAAYIRIEIWRC